MPPRYATIVNPPKSPALYVSGMAMMELRRAPRASH